MRTAARDFGLFYQHVGVARTGAAFFAEDACKVDIAPPLPLCIDVVSVGATALFDAEVHDVFDFIEQKSELLVSHVAHPGGRMDFRTPK